MMLSPRKTVNPIVQSINVLLHVVAPSLHTQRVEISRKRQIIGCTNGLIYDFSGGVRVAAVHILLATCKPLEDATEILEAATTHLPPSAPMLLRRQSNATCYALPKHGIFTNS